MPISPRKLSALPWMDRPGQGGRTRCTSMARRTLQLEAKATVKLGSFQGRALLDLALDIPQLLVAFTSQIPITPRTLPAFPWIARPGQGEDALHEYGAQNPSAGS